MSFAAHAAMIFGDSNDGFLEMTPQFGDVRITEEVTETSPGVFLYEFIFENPYAVTIVGRASNAPQFFVIELDESLPGSFINVGVAVIYGFIVELDNCNVCEFAFEGTAPVGGSLYFETADFYGYNTGFGSRSTASAAQSQGLFLVPGPASVVVDAPVIGVGLFALCLISIIGFGLRRGSRRSA